MTTGGMTKTERIQAISGINRQRMAAHRDAQGSSAAGGGSASSGERSFTDEEWKKIIRKMDEYILEVREEQRARAKREDTDREIEAFYQEREVLERYKKPRRKRPRAVSGAISEAELPEELSGTELPPEELLRGDLPGEEPEREELSGEERLPRGGRETPRTLPYAKLEKDGVVTYNGVSFSCDREYHALCLGDAGDLYNLLFVPLEDGGVLEVNRDNLEELSEAIAMFSTEDIRRILIIVGQDAKVKQLEKEKLSEKS